MNYTIKSDLNRKQFKGYTTGIQFHITHYLDPSCDVRYFSQKKIIIDGRMIYYMIFININGKMINRMIS